MHENVPDRGGNNEMVKKEDAQLLLADYLSLQKYSVVRTTSAPPVKHAATDSCSDNREFWERARHFAEGQHILLESFHVTEWLPASPGRYFTERAKMERNRAEQFWTEREYLPLGKLGMILGGIGSVRLASKRTKFGILHFLGATSSGDSNQGIPLCVPSDMYGQLADPIRQYGGMRCQVAGTIQVLDRSIDRISFDPGIPKYAVLADDIRIINPSAGGVIQAAASVLYGGACREYERDYRANNAMGWSFAYFNPAIDSANGLRNAVEWLEDYVRRHSVSEGPRIIGDFDEHMEHSNCPLRCDSPHSLQVMVILRLWPH
jgi:hypothetical protein